MTSNQTLKGVLLIGAGAASYGMLATFVRLAYHDTGITGLPFTPAEVTTSQFVLGILSMFILNGASRFRQSGRPLQANRNEIIQLLAAGTSTGLTSIFYYLAVRFIPVSVAIVLLMQTVWMGVVLEMILERRLPSSRKMVAVAIVITGTAMAVNVFENSAHTDWRGIVLGLLAAASFTTTMFTANRVAPALSAAQRSLYMLLGGGCMVFIFAIATQVTPFNFDIFWKWGLILALFGTVIPPILMNAGFPLTGIGLGSIVAALELPVSVIMAWFVLGELIRPLQWVGIVLIITAIVLMNARQQK